MAVSVDWGTKVITVPKADLTLVQSSPTEIREMDLNWFRMQLKDLEDSEDGMPMDDTHNHNTEVSLGGLTYARVIEIINGYTVTFENGAYAVNLTGANSNVGDVVNVNNVSVRSANSAGLISSPAVEFSSFNGGVIVDVNSQWVGTTFPIGTEQKPVNNIADAILIADYRGFKKIYIHSDITLGSDATLSNFVLEGQSHINTVVTIEDSAQVESVIIRECTIQGTLDGGNDIEKCIVGDITYLNGHIHNSALIGTITLGGSKDAFIVNCSIVDLSHTPSIDMGDSGQNLVLASYTGKIYIENLTGSNKVGVTLNGGMIVLKSTVTNGTIHVNGIGTLVDESGNNIQTGAWNGATIINDLINETNISSAVWDYVSGDTTTYNIIAESWKHISGDRKIENNREYFYDSSGDTVAIFKLLDDTGDSTLTNVYQRVKEFPT